MQFENISDNPDEPHWICDTDTVTYCIYETQWGFRFIMHDENGELESTPDTKRLFNTFDEAVKWANTMDDN